MQVTTVLLACLVASPPPPPIGRPHGFVQVGASVVVGGLEGLAIWRGKNWETISHEPVRQVLQQGSAIWALYGSGSVDKIEPVANRLTYDVMHERAKRPWVSSLSIHGETLFMGTEGGWMSLGPQGFTQTYPAEMKGHVVTCMAQHKGVVWLGTHTGGLFRVAGSKISRYGFASGMPDPWITALIVDHGQLLVGTASGGMVRISGSKAIKWASPSPRIRHLALHQGRLVVGALDGTWRKQRGSWEKLSAEEATFLGASGRLLKIGTPAGILER